MSASLTPGIRRALKRIPAILREDVYATDTSLGADLGLEWRDLRAAVSILYRQRRIDRIGAYIVASAAPRQPLQYPGTSGRAT